MKKFNRLLIVLALLFAINVPFIASRNSAAETTGGSTDSSTQDQTTGTETEEAFKARQEERIKAENITLANVEKTRIKARCQAAQAKLSPDEGRVKGVLSHRDENYTKLVTRLSELDTKLKAAGVSTTDLDADISALHGKIDTFNTDMVTYHQALADLVKVQCQQDPAAFKAALLVVRTNVEKVKADSRDIKDYLNNTVKPLLKQLRSQLEKTKGN